MQQQQQQQQQQPMPPTPPTQQPQPVQSSVRPRQQLVSTGACPEELLGQPGPLARAPSMRKRYSYANKACHSTDEVLLDDGHQGCQESSEIALSCDSPTGETTVRGGTLRGLVEFAISCFEVSNKEVHVANQNFLEVFFLMHEWISDSVTVVSTVIELCERNSQMLRRGLLMIRFWINKHPSAFEANKSLATLVEAFFERVNARDLDDIVSTMNIRDITRHEWLRLDSMKKDRVSSSSMSSLVFNQLEAEQLAEQLTVLEFKAFRRIRIPDLKAYTSGESLRGSPTLERCVLLFNGLSQWVQCMVLSKSTPAERARVVAKFLEVAEELLKLKNFNTLMAVIGGLSHSAIARLSKTHACLSQRSQKLLVDFSEFLSSSSNFASYRKEYAEAREFKIPILAVHLKDLIQLNVAVPDKLSGSGRFINWRKVAQLGQTMSLLHSAQRAPLPVEENVALCNTLRLSLDCHYTEDDIYEVSLLREPRSLVSPSTPTKPVVFAQWVSGSKPPHPETLKRHIFDMVEAVFKVYDHDKDEMISEAEFAQIAENFPFIDSFAVLDTDNDGMISKNELKNYFIRANSHALKNSFKHDFHETSYFKPTFCDRCNGLLWGLIKQGWKCRDCGINVHKHCKDTVVMECRVRAQGHRGVSAIAETATAATSAGSNSTISTVACTGTTAGSGASNGGPVCGSSAATAGCVKASGGSGGSGCCSPVATEDGWAQTDEDGRCIDEAQKLAQENEALRGEADTLRQQVQSQAQVIARLRSQVTNMRQQTISFILHQMDTLEIQRNSEV